MPTQRNPRFLTPCTLALAIALAVAPPAQSLRGAHFLGIIQGEVYIRRFFSFLPQQASTGDLIQTDQTLQVKPNSQVTLICSNHTRHLLTPGTYSVEDYCPPPPASSGTSRNPTREIFESNQPYPLSPRNTALLSTDSFLIQWHEDCNNDEVTPAQITVKGKDIEWTVDSDLNEIPYQGPQTFKPDRSYTLTVEAGGKESKAQFSLLPESERDRVMEEVAAVQALDLDPDAEAIGLALIYLNYQHSDSDRHSNSLNLDALRVVQARIQAGSRNSQLYLLEAEAYLAMDLPLEARQSFQQALALAETNEEPERLADSYKGLGQIAARQTEDANAREFFQKALDLYETLSDGEQIENIKDELRTLSNNDQR